MTEAISDLERKYSRTVTDKDLTPSATTDNAVVIDFSNDSETVTNPVKKSKTEKENKEVSIDFSNTSKNSEHQKTSGEQSIFEHINDTSDNLVRIHEDLAPTHAELTQNREGTKASVKKLYETIADVKAELNGVISETQMKVLCRYLKRNNLTITKEEIENAKKLIKESSQTLGIDFESFSAEEKIFYGGLIVELQRGNLTPDELIAILKEYGNDEIKAKVQNLHPENGGGISEEKMSKFRNEIEKLAKMHSVMTMTAAKHIHGKDDEETKKLREQYLLKTTDFLEDYNRKIMEDAVELLPAGCSKHDAEKIVKSIGTFATEASKSLFKLAKKNNFSNSLLNTLSAIVTRIAESEKERTANFLEWFFNNTVRGRILKNDYLEHKEECKEKYAILNKKREEAKVASKQAEEAIENAKKMKAKATSIIEGLGFKNLDAKKSEKLLKKVSFSNWVKLQDANEAQEQAYWAAYDAKSAQKLAESSMKFAVMDMMVAVAKIKATISGLMG